MSEINVPSVTIPQMHDAERTPVLPMTPSLQYVR